MGNTHNFVAAGIIPTFALIKDSSGSAVVATANTEFIIGCTQETGADSGDNFAGYLPGQKVKLRCGGTIAKHVRFMATTTGEIVTFSTGAGVYALGYTLEAGVENDVIEVFFDPSLNAEDA